MQHGRLRLRANFPFDLAVDTFETTIHSVPQTAVSTFDGAQDSLVLDVLRTIDQRHPAVALDTFDNGYHQGWLVVFDLESGRPLCAQAVRAQNSPSVGVGTFQGGSDAAMADLVTNLDAAKSRRASRSRHSFG